MKKIPTVCKKVSDPPEETVGAWEEVYCEICNTKLRRTIKAREVENMFNVTLFPICFECALLGPEVIQYEADKR